MPLFESQEARNDRTMFEALRPLVLKLQQLPDREAREHYETWIVTGSSTAVGAVTLCQDLRKVWGKGDVARATALTEVFTLALMSRWSRIMGTEADPQERRRRLEASVTAVLDIFGTFSQEKLHDAMLLDLQYNHDEDNAEDVTNDLAPPEVRLRLALARQACGEKVKVDLSRVRFPVATRRDLERARVPVSHSDDNVILHMVLEQSVDAMVEYYDKYARTAE